MTKYEEIKEIIHNQNLEVKSIQVVDENLVIVVSDTLTLTFYEFKNTLDLYINEYYFGNLYQQDMEVIMRELLKDNKVFIKFRKPRGLKKVYFKIEVLEEYHKNERKYLNYRGIKIFTKDSVILDKY